MRSSMEKTTCVSSLGTKTDEVPVSIKEANTPLSRRKKSHSKLGVCTKCKKYFPLRLYLMQHLRFYSMDKPFTCNICRKALEEKNALKCYRPRFKKPSLAERKNCGLYMCKTCNASFIRMYDFETHLQIHLGVRKHFACNKCEKSFNRKSVLTRHLKFHLNIRPFKCDGCDKTFVQKCDLARHQETHSKTRSLYYCHECDRVFSSKYFLLNHEKKQLQNSDENEL